MEAEERKKDCTYCRKLWNGWKVECGNGDVGDVCGGLSVQAG